jgi:acyl-coenzyme A synthetase/AMP-(fatty) acid ligase
MFDGYIRDHARWSPRAPAVVTGARAWSYAQLDADVDRCAAALQALDLSPRAVVSVAVTGAQLQLLVTAALARLGVASSPATDWGADLRLTDGEPAPDGPPAIRLDAAWIAAMLAAEPRPVPPRALDPLAVGRVMLSSGTTGQAKRVGYTWRRLEHGNHLTVRSYCAPKLGAHVPLVGLDAMMGLSMAMCAWAVGAPVTETFVAEDLPPWLETLEPGLVAMTPIQLQRLLAALPPGFQPRPGWRLVVGGAVLPPGVAREARLRITPDIRTIYGSTEGGNGGLGYAAGLDDAPGQVGITPSGALVAIVDDHGRPVPEGEPGEIRIRGPRVIQGYLGDPDAAAERFEDGWFLTRDVGRRLPDGRIVLEGRADDRMLLDGRKVMPQALEALVLACPGLQDAAVFAVPDTDGIDTCWIAVTAEPGFDRDRLAVHLADRPDVPPYRLAWIDTIPRNAMGKVQRDVLRDAVLAATRANPGASA